MWIIRSWWREISPCITSKKKQENFQDICNNKTIENSTKYANKIKPQHTKKKKQYLICFHACACACACMCACVCVQSNERTKKKEEKATTKCYQRSRKETLYSKHPHTHAHALSQTHTHTHRQQLCAYRTALDFSRLRPSAWVVVVVAVVVAECEMCVCAYVLVLYCGVYARCHKISLKFMAHML